MKILMLFFILLPFAASRSNIFEELLKGVLTTKFESCIEPFYDNRMPVLPFDKKQNDFESKITAFDVCIKDFNQMTDQLLSDFRPIAEQEFDKVVQNHLTHDNEAISADKRLLDILAATLDAKFKQFLATYDGEKLQKRNLNLAGMINPIKNIFQRPKQSEAIHNYLNDDLTYRDQHLSDPASEFVNRYPESEYGLSDHSVNMGSSLSSLENTPRRPPFNSEKNKEKKWYDFDNSARYDDGTINYYTDEHTVQSLNGFQLPPTPHSNAAGPNLNLHLYDDDVAIPPGIQMGRFDDDAISDIHSEHSFGALDEIDYFAGPNSNGHDVYVNSIPQYNGIHQQQSFDEVFDMPQ